MDGRTAGPTVEVRSPQTSAIDTPAGADPTTEDALDDRVLRIQEGVHQLLARFDEKLLHDAARTNEIRRLNAELAKHQPDAQWNVARPFVDHMIRHLEGDVILEVTVDRQGHVSNVSVLRSSVDAVAEAAVEAVRQWRYEPSIVNGRAVSVMLTETVRFQIAN